MKGGNNDKRWLTMTIYVNVDTGEIYGQKMPKNHYKVKEINKTLTNDGTYTIIERTIGCREHGEQTELQFGEYRIGSDK